MTDNIKAESEKVREFGQKNDYKLLTKRKWDADEIDGWEMTSSMAYLIKAKGAYRIPTEKVYSFIVFTEIELID